MAEAHRNRLRAALISGSAASVLSSLVLSWRSARETRHATAGTNATSHWIWGGPARHRLAPDLSHTVVGYAIHHAASMFWAAWYEAAFPRSRSLPGACARAAATAAIACFVDFRLTPRRFTPGFETHLSRRSLAVVYAAFAFGLVAPAAATAMRRRRSRVG